MNTPKYSLMVKKTEDGKWEALLKTDDLSYAQIEADVYNQEENPFDIGIFDSKTNIIIRQHQRFIW